MLIPTSIGNQCTVYQGGCKYRLTMVQTGECMSGDAPIPESQEDHDILSSKHNFITQIQENTVDASVVAPASREEEMRRLDELESKLTKMMEGLSVRSLRHIRQIRNDLRQMNERMESMRSETSSSGKSKRKAGLAPNTCPDEFSTVGTWSSCYRFSTFNATWPEAREYCSAFGGNLVALETLQESYILDYLIKSNPGKEHQNEYTSNMFSQ